MSVMCECGGKDRQQQAKNQAPEGSLKGRPRPPPPPLPPPPPHTFLEHHDRSKLRQLAKLHRRLALKGKVEAVAHFEGQAACRVQLQCRKRVGD